jgi:hypothetical protein
MSVCVCVCICRCQWTHISYGWLPSLSEKKPHWAGYRIQQGRRYDDGLGICLRLCTVGPVILLYDSVRLSETLAGYLGGWAHSSRRTASTPHLPPHVSGPLALALAKRPLLSTHSGCQAPWPLGEKQDMPELVPSTTGGPRYLRASGYVP